MQINALSRRQDRLWTFLAPTNQILRVMQLSAFFLLALAISVSAKTSSQTVTLKVKDAKLEQLFSEVKNQTGFVFVYNEEAVEKSTPVSIEAENLPLKEFLNQILMDKPFEYAIRNRTIFIRVKKLAGDLKSPASPSPFTPPADPITGVVKDSTGMPLSGATVTNKRTKKSVQTNSKGEFTIEGDEGDILIMSFIGFESQSLRVTGNSPIIILRVSTSPLDEVQIQAYGKISRRLNTGNITTIKADDIGRQPVDNPLLGLMGKVPNLQITPSSGLPGAPFKIQLRGQNSLSRRAQNAGFIQSEPLFVIDGVPYSNNMPGHNGSVNALNLSALSFVNPADIESIDVLSDADATSIYGSRGGSGVIIITTKKGKAGRTRINVNMNAGFSEASNKLKLMNTQQYLEMRKEAFRNDNQAPQITNKNANTYAADLLLWDQDKYTDWQEVLLGGTGKRFNVQTSISGGSSSIQYLIGYTYYKQGYIFPGDSKDESNTLHFNLTGASNNQKFRASLTGNYTANGRFSPSTDFTGLAVSLAPNAPELLKLNGELNWEPNPNLTSTSGTWTNPFASILRRREAETENINASGEISYNLVSNLTLKTAIGFNNIHFNSLELTPIASLDPSLPANSKRGSASRNNNSVRSWTVEPQANYITSIDKGKLDVLIGFSVQSSIVTSQALSARGYTNDALIRNLGAAQVVGTQPAYFSSNSSSEYKYTGLFSRLNYNWEDKYILNVSGRRDGSSRFGPGRKFGKFWSIGSAWIFSNENNFSAHIPLISFGKLRASYGSSGNDAIGDYQYLQLYTPYTVNNINYQDLPGIVTQGAVNPYYSWEDIRKQEVALELGFMKDRILVSTTYWKTRSGNQLGNVFLPATGGNISIVANLDAKIQNTGWDITLNTRNIISGNFHWSTTANIGWLNNKLLSAPDGFFGEFPIAYPEGIDPIGRPFTGFESVYEFKGVNPATGLNQFLDQSNNIAIREMKDYASIITTAPKYSGGINNSFTYKGITLDIFLQYVKQMGNNYLYDFPFKFPGSWAPAGTAGNLPVAFMDRWKYAGDLTSIQKVSTAPNGYIATLRGYASRSDAAYVDASFMRIQNVQLAYNITGNLKQKMKLQNLRMYLQAQNLFTFTAYEGLDPQVQSVNSLPLLRTIVIGMQVGF